MSSSVRLKPREILQVGRASPSSRREGSVVDDGDGRLLDDPLVLLVRVPHPTDGVIFQEGSGIPSRYSPIGSRSRSVLALVMWMLRGGECAGRPDES